MKRTRNACELHWHYMAVDTWVTLSLWCLNTLHHMHKVQGTCIHLFIWPVLNWKQPQWNCGQLSTSNFLGKSYVITSDLIFVLPKLLVGLSLSPPATRILELDKDSFLVRLEMVLSLEDTCSPATDIYIRPCWPLPSLGPSYFLGSLFTGSLSRTSWKVASKLVGSI